MYFSCHRRKVLPKQKKRYKSELSWPINCNQNSTTSTLIHGSRWNKWFTVKRSEILFLTISHSIICIGNSMIFSDIWNKYHELISKFLYLISRAVKRAKFEAILKYHKWYLCRISHTNHAIICLYYHPQKVCSFHI